jgi:hypothetical protein
MIQSKWVGDKVERSLLGFNTPMSVIYPCILLALFAAVLGASTPPALCKLAGILLPFAALIVGALPNAALRVVLAAQIPHNHTSPILHFRGVMPDGKLFNQGKMLKSSG